MTRRKVLICPCPDLAIDGRELAARLKEMGVPAELGPPLCTPDGLARLKKLTAAKAGTWLVAACGPEIHAGFLPEPVVDVRSCADLSTAMGALT
ncbi:MAG: hypothetical protein WBV23_13945, partial [Desulfobaccales bacterium]